MRKSVNQIIKKAVKDLISLGGNKIAYKTTTPIKLGLSMTDLSKVSYITEKRQWQLIENNVVLPEAIKNNTIDRKKYFYHTSVEKLLQKYVEICESTEGYSKIVLDVKKQLFDHRKVKLSSFEGEQIGKLYATECHKLGTMSCMQGKPEEYFEIYNNLPVKLYTIIFNGDIYARCLVWFENRKENASMYIDRIYTFAQSEPLSKHIYKYMIEQIYKEEKRDFKNIRAYNIHHTSLIGFSSPNFYDVRLDTTFGSIESFPYMDSFKYVNSDNDTICHDNCGATHLLEDTHGGYEEIGRECECCGNRIERDEEYYCDDSEETLCGDCVEYSEADGVYYRHDLVRWVGGNVSSYVLESDID